MTHRLVSNPQALINALSSGKWDLLVLGKPVKGFPADEAVRLARAVSPEIPIISLPDHAEPTALHDIISGLCSAEDRHGRSLSLLSDMLDTLPQAVFWKDAQGVYLGCNRVFAELAGLEDPLHVIGKTDRDFPWGRRGVGSYRADDLEVMRTGEPKRNIVQQITWVDGSETWVRTTKAPLLNESGDVYGVLGISENVTEQKRSDEILWQTTQMLQLVLNTIPARVFWKDTNSVYLGCNYLFAANAGLSSPEEIVGKTDFDLPWTRAESESYRADDRQVMETGIPKLNYEETQYIAEGRTTWVRTSKIPLRDPEGNVIGVLGTFEDITQRKMAEEALQREAALTKAILDTATVVVIIVDRRGRIVRFNRYAEHITGYSFDEVKGRRLWDVLMPEEDIQTTRESFRHAFQHKKVDYFENYWRSRDGRLHRLAWSGTVLYDGHEEPQYILGIGLDVTERMRLEEDKRQFYRETIRSVTDGKLEIANPGEVHPYEAASGFRREFANVYELAEARHQLEQQCVSESLQLGPEDLFITAVGEAMNNALKHAGRGVVFCGSRGEEFWAGVSDSGSGIAALTLPKATLRRGYSTKVSLGMGYSIMLDASDRVMLKTGPDGTMVIMFKSLQGKRRSVSLADLPDTWETVAPL